MPFWTIILLAGWMAIPQELYEAAKVWSTPAISPVQAYHRAADCADLYLVCVLLDTIFALGDFNSTFFVSGRWAGYVDRGVGDRPGIRYAFTTALPRMGVATVMTALPLLIPLVYILMRKLRMKEGQL